MTEKLPLKQKLALLRAHMADLELPKSGWNNHSQFSYYELGDFLPQALQYMAELKMIGHIDFRSDAEYVFLHIIDTEDDPADMSQIMTFAIERSVVTIQGAQPIQNTGGSHTFYRRYLWIDVLELSEPDSIDAEKNPRQGQQNQESKWINKQDEHKILALKTVAEIEAAVKKLLDDGRMIGSDRIKRIDARKAEIEGKSKPKKEEDILYATLAQMQELLAITDIMLLKDKKDKILKAGGHFTKIQADQLSTHYQKLLDNAVKGTEETEAELSKLDDLPLE